eukprot:CAMPEP_0170379500 /NCGR_PEP_ID=MMETSP0117_2-20130122/13375_1 /TAXON_ID=400756 /ORGANISM="Durinskia baltica, Strain CSIRO CS-38" /LENGTH=505 /DNA_ID=CAMNT_0010634941 /DNA_START=66 /DNA_END=1583 /DNA_ORIENTATION=-
MSVFRAKGNIEVYSFLTCTLRQDSPLSKLRGHEHIIRHIWELASEEWWDLHVERFPVVPVDCFDEGDGCEVEQKIVRLDATWKVVHDDDYPSYRKLCAGCPAAIVKKGLQFPPPSGIYVNMMPIRLGTSQCMLPDSLSGYEEILKFCLPFAFYSEGEVAYLTIDERQTEASEPQRRPGLHVESPGFMPVLYGPKGRGRIQKVGKSGSVDETFRLPSGRFVPGAEHHWGRGIMMRGEKVEGGIFMASNVSNTTAVWNCHINDEGGNFIGTHGDIERFRPLLGDPSYVLKAGELLWMTDRTPHESLPVQPVRGVDGSLVVPHRQYFRLVLGEVSAWFADHSTPSELGVVPPKSVKIIYGDKFELYPKVSTAWSFGTKEQIEEAYALRELRLLLCRMGLGHHFEGMKRVGIVNITMLLTTTKYRRTLAEQDALVWRGAHYYDIPRLDSLTETVKVYLESKAAYESEYGLLASVGAGGEERRVASRRLVNDVNEMLAVMDEAVLQAEFH